MTDKLLQLAAYGFLVRMIVEGIQVAFKISGSASPRLVQVIAAAVSAVFVYLLGLNPAVMLGMGKMIAENAVAQLVGVALLTGAAASTNDLLDLLPKLGGKR